MRGHRYRITVERLDGDGAPLVFEAVNHDEIIGVAGRIRDSGQFADDDSAHAFAVGLKLFGETLLTHRQQPPFAGLLPAFKQFMQTLKAQATRPGG